MILAEGRELLLIAGIKVVESVSIGAVFAWKAEEGELELPSLISDSTCLCSLSITGWLINLLRSDSMFSSFLSFIISAVESVDWLFVFSEKVVFSFSVLPLAVA